MKKVIVLNKKEGETPLEAMEAFRASNKQYKDFKMTYAGRLDPMASGLLLVLVGDEVKNKEKYLKLNKKYDFEILFGFATDTYDVLGKVVKTKKINFKKEEIEKNIKRELKNFKGKIVQTYPIYSSKTVLGKPLFSYARSGQKVDIPKKEVHIKTLKLNKIKTIRGSKLKNDINKRILKVRGDFRQSSILKVWNKKIDENSLYFIASMQVSCSSGTYVRSISDSLGQKINAPGIAWSIKRVSIGNFGGLHQR